MSDNKPKANVTTDSRHPAPKAAPRVRHPRLERAKFYLIVFIIVAPFVFAYAWLKDQAFNWFGKIVAPLWYKVGLAIYHHFGYGALVAFCLVLFSLVMYYAVKDNWPKRRRCR